MTAPSSDSAAIRQIIRALKAAGYRLDYVNNGEESVGIEYEQDAIDAIMEVDMAWLYVSQPGFAAGGSYIFFVMGNSPEEVAADYTLDLEHVLEPLTDRWES